MIKSRGFPFAGLVLVCYLGIAVSEVYEKWGMVEDRVTELIIGGTKVKAPGAYPWHVAILYTGNLRGGGSIISEQYVLTVTHLTYENDKEVDPSLLTVKAGIIKLTGNGSTYKVADIVRYPGYNKETLLNDICLIKLAEKVIFQPTIGPVKLWDNPDKLMATVKEGKLKEVVVGFGLTEASSPSDDLQSVQLRHVDDAECKLHVPNFREVLKKNFNFCAIGEKATICRGDSGGGLVYFNQNRQRYYLRGIVSQGVWQGESCVTAKEALFTDIAHYIKWIERSALPTMYNLLGLPECSGYVENEESRMTLPALVSLKYAFRKTFFISDCQGVLITRKHVLTQANCVASSIIRKLQHVEVGSSAINDQFEPSQQFDIGAIEVEKELAIITLDKEVDVSIKPVCIPTRPEDGDRSIIFWKKEMKHPKQTEIVEIPQQHNKTEQTNQQDLQKLKVEVDGENERLGSTPILYTVSDDTGKHVYLKALEKCSLDECGSGESTQFVDVLAYREWIRRITKDYLDESILEPQLD